MVQRQNEYEDVVVSYEKTSVVCQTLIQNPSFCSIQAYFWQLLPLAYCKLISGNINM